MKAFRLILPLLLVVSSAAWGESVPLPTSVMGVNEIVANIRQPMVTKLSDLGKNYISTSVDNVLVYSSSEELDCNGGKHIAGAALGSVQYASRPGKNELMERVTYTGCNGEVSLYEDTFTKGTDLKPMKFSDVIKGDRPLDLADNETFRLFKISNFEGDVLFSVLIEKKEGQKVAVFSILGEKFLVLNYEYKADSTKLLVSPFGYSIKYVRTHGTWNSTSTFTPFVNTIIAQKGKPVIYLDQNNKLQSLSNYLKTFQSYVSDAISTVNEFIDYHTYYYPMTEATKTGNMNQRLIDELRVTQNRLQTNTDVILVKNFIQELISAAEIGRIIDNRPKK